MPRFIASARRRVALTTTKPAAFAQDAATPATVDEAALALYASGRVTNYDLGPKASDEIDDKPLDASGNAKGLGNKNFSGGLTAYRFFNSSGAADGSEDGVYALLAAAAKAGTTVYVYHRLTSKVASDDWATGDEVTVVECLVDIPSDPEDSQTQWIKNRFELKPQRWAQGVLAAGSGSAVPLISAATPSGALATKIVTITGARFTGVTAVTFGGTAATAFSVISDSLLAATMPSGSAGSAAIIVTNAAGASASFAYTRGA